MGTSSYICACILLLGYAWNDHINIGLFRNTWIIRLGTLQFVLLLLLRLLLQPLQLLLLSNSLSYHLCFHKGKVLEAHWFTFLQNLSCVGLPCFLVSLLNVCDWVESWWTFSHYLVPGVDSQIWHFRLLSLIVMVLLIESSLVNVVKRGTLHRGPAVVSICLLSLHQVK